MLRYINSYIVNDLGRLYIHIPVCKKKCIYCDFYSCGANAVDFTLLSSALCNELRCRNHEIPSPLHSIYIGGGTPSLLPPEALEKIRNTIFNIYDIADDCEFTMEVNPDDVSEQLCATMKSIGINRVSCGIQSLIDSELKAIGRRHDSSGARKAMEIISKEFENYSFDLMFGLPSQTLQSWKETVEGVLAYNPKHISAYSLMYEEGTAITLLRNQGRLAEVDGDTAERMFRYLCERTERNGLRRYETSNYAIPGMESRHNMSYWKGVPYLGIGPSAHSYDGKRTRRYNPADLRSYIDFFSSSRKDEYFYDYESLTDEELREEYIMTRMRLSSGLDLLEFQKRFGDEESENLAKRIEVLKRRREVVEENGKIMIPQDYILISDSILVDLI